MHRALAHAVWIGDHSSMQLSPQFTFIFNEHWRISMQTLKRSQTMVYIDSRLMQDKNAIVAQQIYTQLPRINPQHKASTTQTLCSRGLRASSSRPSRNASIQRDHVQGPRGVRMRARVPSAPRGGAALRRERHVARATTSVSR